jgi:nickel-dependent lactate racemase
VTTPEVRLGAGDFLEAVADELERAQSLHAPMNSSHEAYAVILEELDEYWEEVRKRRSERRPASMWVELVQIAAMAARAAIETEAACHG